MIVKFSSYRSYKKNLHNPQIFKKLKTHMIIICGKLCFEINLIVFPKIKDYKIYLKYSDEYHII